MYINNEILKYDDTLQKSSSQELLSQSQPNLAQSIPQDKDSSLFLKNENYVLYKGDIAKIDCGY